MTHALLRESVAIVTGASRGIGAEVARGLAAAGAAVGLVARSSASLDTVAEDLRQARLGPIAVAVADVSDAASLERAVDQLTEELGPVQILVNNAGTIHHAPAAQASPAAWRRVIDTNLTAALLASSAVLPQMRQAGGGSIVNIASLSARFGIYNAVSYAASKSGLVGLTRALAWEWAGYGIRVNAVSPGYVVTDFTKPLTADERRSRHILERIPLGRWGRPEDIAGTVVYLSSPLAEYVTGQVITVDGGYSVNG